MNADGVGRTKTKPGIAIGSGAFYRVSRMLHAYLSAFAFLALIFFSLTGVLLNHPDWFAQPRPAAQEIAIALPLAEVQAAARANDPALALAALAQQHADLRGEYRSGDLIDGEALLRFEGATGDTDVAIDLARGDATATIQPADAVTVLHELHRGTKSGAAWRALIDITAYLVLALSLIGYVLFFSLRYRWKTSLALTALSLGVMGALFYFLVP
jgi:uncharacterized protein